MGVGVGEVKQKNYQNEIVIMHTLLKRIQYKQTKKQNKMLQLQFSIIRWFVRY